MVVELTSIVVPSGDQVRHLQHNTVAFIDSTSAPIGKGSLYISTERLLWVTDNGQGFSLEYPMIALHAISRDLTNFNSECLYLMTEESNVSDTESTDGSDSRNNEIRFVPEDKSQLDIMFKAMSECQALHPDPNDSISEDEEEGDEEEGDYNNEEIFEDADNDQTKSNGDTNCDDTAAHVVYDVASAERSRGVPPNLMNNNLNNATNDDEPMEVVGQFDDADNDQ
ncbi:methylosome subunit pICln-like [Oppia nitens]|uniref:methylosome subunit pICln-like n=1 Tax=Oppia nitens TaxID=1686743 RepID=UPI0023DB6E2B|nr:methylosome subunit pICln-like [Oppia nitens]